MIDALYRRIDGSAIKHEARLQGHEAACLTRQSSILLIHLGVAVIGHRQLLLANNGHLTLIKFQKNHCASEGVINTLPLMPAINSGNLPWIAAATFTD